MYQFPSVGLNDRSLKLKELVIRVRITGDAIAADVVHLPEFSEDVKLQTAGKNDIDDVDASISITGITNATNAKFGLLVKKEALGLSVERLIKGEVLLDVAGTATAYAITPEENNGASDNGHLICSVTGTGLDLAGPENCDIFLKLTVLLK